MTHLSFEERRVISQSLLHGIPQSQIALQLGRSPSTISREIARNDFDDGLYHAQRAHRNAIDRRSKRTVTPKLERPGIYEKVASKLELNWSPQQISCWLALEEGVSVISHQTIYSYLWCLPKDHAHRLGMRRRGRRPRKAKPGFITKKFKHRVSIHDRPKAINERLRIGDWELDLMSCHLASGYLITAVERKTGYTLIRKVPSKHTDRVMSGIVKMFEPFHRSLIKSFTFDNGTEFYSHRRLTRELGVKVYFADPYNSGQRGTNENTNGLIRQYFEKFVDYKQITHGAVRKAQQKLNERPRLRLQYQTPRAVLGKHPKIAFRI